MSASVPSPGATKAALAFRAQYVEATEGTVPLPDGGVFCTPAERDGVVALRALVAADIERLLPPDERAERCAFWSGLSSPACRP